MAKKKPKTIDVKYPEIIFGVVANGPHKGKLLKFRSQCFAALAAPTRSGKGVSIIIPNLLNYRDSIICNDIKLENFRKTAGYRQSQGQQVFLFSPDGFVASDNGNPENTELRSHGWNCLSYVRRNPIFRVGDILNIANVFYPVTGDKNDIWNESAGKLFKGLVLYLLDNENEGDNLPVSMSQVLKLSTPDGGLAAWMKQQIELGVVSDECKAEFNAFMHAPEETRGSILTNFVSPLAIFSDAVCAAATSKDDFDLRQVRRQRMSIYIGIKPANIKRFSKLLNLFWSQLINENTQVEPEFDESLKYQCLMVLDEFTSLGRVEIIKQSVSFTASYNMRFLIIYQTDAQLNEAQNYGKDGAKVLKDNMGLKIVFPPKEVDELAKSLSETLGYKTVKKRTVTRTSGKSHSKTYGEKEEKRALMLPQEIVELGFETYKNTDIGQKQIIIMDNMRPFIADKIIYFYIPEFSRRADFSKKNIPEIPLLDLSDGNIELPQEYINSKVKKRDEENENMEENTTVNSASDAGWLFSTN